MAYSNLTHSLLRTDGLLERAEAALQCAVAADPDDATALLRLGDVQRGRGRLGEALDSYRRVLSLRPSDLKASWLVAILSGEGVAEGQACARPVPFVHRTDFLPPSRCSQLLAFAQVNREHFEPGVVGVKGKVDPSIRKALVERQVSVREVQPWFEPLLRDAFSDALPRLRMPEPSEYWVEIAMAAYLGGGFLAKHTDNSVRPFDTRTLSFAYYFHRQPRRFSGGELLLHDGDGDASAFTRIEPLHNSIVFFPSSALHQIAPVEIDIDGFDEDRPQDASQTNGFADARFAIHGWLRTHSAD